MNGYLFVLLCFYCYTNDDGILLCKRHIIKQFFLSLTNIKLFFPVHIHPKIEVADLFDIYIWIEMFAMIWEKNGALLAITARIWIGLIFLSWWNGNICQ